MKLSRYRPFICLITPGDLTTENFSTKRNKVLQLISLAAECGVSLVQIREKLLSARLLFGFVSAAIRAVAGSDMKMAAKIVVSDRFDVALAAGADGVHLPANGFPAGVVKKHVPEGFIVGVSTHSLEEIGAAREGGADYVVFGPVFDSPGKPNPVGLDELRHVCDVFPDLPILGLGGIDETNYEAVLETGASGFAAIRFLNREQDLRLLRERFAERKE